MNALRNTLLYGGIEPPLKNIARKLEEQASLDVQVLVRAGDTLPQPLQNCLYQIALEAANNVKKHSRARRLYIGLSYVGGSVELRVKDDGQGFRYEEMMEEAIKHGHIGLHSMKERAAELGGTMHVLSSPGRGAEMIFSFPPSYATTSALTAGLQDTGPQEAQSLDKVVYMAGLATESGRRTTA